MSVYVDDIIISGEKASKKLQWEVKKIIWSHNLKYHTVRNKTKLYRKNTAKRVTGTIIVGNEIKLRNKSHKEIHDGLIALDLEKNIASKQKIIQKLLGKVNEASQFDDTFKGKAEYLMNLQKHLKRENKRKTQTV